MRSPGGPARWNALASQLERLHALTFKRSPSSEDPPLNREGELPSSEDPPLRREGELPNREGTLLSREGELPRSKGNLAAPGGGRAR